MIHTLQQSPGLRSVDYARLRNTSQQAAHKALQRLVASGDAVKRPDGTYWPVAIPDPSTMTVTAAPGVKRVIVEFAG